MEIVINFDDKNFYIIARRDETYTIECSENRIKISEKKEKA